MSALTLVAATGNKHKLLEIQTVANRFALNVLAPKDVCTDTLAPEVIEDGTTFLENALIKAKAFSAWAQMPALGDDSGLVVEALNGEPGIYSARYGGPGLSDFDRMRVLLKALDDKEKETGVVNRRAWFVCHLALYFPDGRVEHAESRLEGEVLRELRGSEGFGYDPIIYIPSIKATLAEVDFSVTTTKGFRAHALEELFGRING